MKLGDEEVRPEPGRFYLRTFTTVPETVAVVLLCASETEPSDKAGA